jgi:hypothetical protein
MIKSWVVPTCELVIESSVPRYFFTKENFSLVFSVHFSVARSYFRWIMWIMCGERLQKAMLSESYGAHCWWFVPWIVTGDPNVHLMRSCTQNFEGRIGFKSFLKLSMGPYKATRAWTRAWALIGKNKRDNKTLKRSGWLRDGVICHIYSNARDVEHWVQLFVAVLRACILHPTYVLIRAFFSYAHVIFQNIFTRL